MNENGLQFGYARRNINPSMPISLAGYFNARMWTGILDDLEVKALFLKQGNRQAGIVLFDLVGLPAPLVKALREAVADLPGLNPEHVLFTATHTHTAPEVRSPKPGFNPDYPAFVVEQAAAALREAAGNLRPGSVVLGRTSDDRFAFNRRYWMKDGTVVTNPPRGHPDIVRPEGPTEPEIPLLGFRDEGGLRVLLANIVNHGDTIGGTQVSADWPGFLRRALEQDLGPDSMVMPLVGAAGNINHFDQRHPANQTCYAEARRIGEGYAQTVRAALPGLRPSRSNRLAVRAGECRTGPREISEAELAEARDHAARYSMEASGDLTSEDLAKRSPAALKYFADQLLELARDRSPRSYPVLAMHLGDAALVSLPCEPFVEIGLRIKRELSADRMTLVVELGNASAAYIPNRFNFGRGGYETTPRCSPNAMDTDGRLLDAARELLEGLRRDAAGAA